MVFEGMVYSSTLARGGGEEGVGMSIGKWII